MESVEHKAGPASCAARVEIWTTATQNLHKCDIHAPLLVTPHKHLAVVGRLLSIDDLMRQVIDEVDLVHPSMVNSASLALRAACEQWRSQAESIADLSRYTHTRSAT